MANNFITRFINLVTNAKEATADLDGAAAGLGRVDAANTKVTQSTKNLNASIIQISRELPNFGQSFEIGIRSITNNIGALLDGISQVKAANAELAAQGLATKSVFSEVVSGIFSFQTLLFVGVGLLASYSKEIGDLIFGLSAAEKAQEALNKSVIASNNLHTTQQVNIEALRDAVLDVSAAEEDRVVALNALKEIIPELDGADLSHAGTLEQVVFWTNKYIEASIARARTDKLIADIAKLQNEQDIAKNTATKDQLTGLEKAINFVGKYLNYNAALEEGTAQGTKRIREEIKAREDQINVLKRLLAQNIITAEQFESSLLGLKDKEKKGPKDTSAEDEKKRLKEIADFETKIVNDTFAATAHTEQEKLDNQKRLDQERLDSLRTTGEEAGRLQAELDAKYVVLQQNLNEKLLAELDKYLAKFKEKNKTFADARTEDEVEATRLRNEAILIQQEQDDMNMAIAKGASSLQLYEITKFYNDLITKNNQDAADANDAIKKKAAKTDKEIAKEKEDANKKARDQAKESLNEIADLLGRQTAAGKAAAIASTTISTYESATKAFDAFAGIPVVGPALGYAAAAVAIIAGLANVKKILAVKVDKEPGNSGVPGGGSTPGIPTPAAQFNIVGQTPTNALLSTLTGRQQVVKSYVVGSDVTSQQSLDRNRIEQSVFL